MPDDNPQDQEPVYTFQSMSQAEGFRDIARIHRREAQQLLSRARTAEAEDQPQEAKLLLDMAKSRQEMAEQYEKAADGDGHDPLMAEMLSLQQDQRASVSSAIQQEQGHRYTAVVEDSPGKEPESTPEPPPEGRFARAVSWLSGGKQ